MEIEMVWLNGLGFRGAEWDTSLDKPTFAVRANASGARIVSDRFVAGMTLSPEKESWNHLYSFETQ